MNTNKESNNEVKCLLAGIDTLEIGVCVDSYLFEREMLDRLSEAKERARSTDYTNDKGGVEFCNYTFSVNRGGAQRYNFILRNQDLEVKINETAKGGRYFPEVHIKFMAAKLWRNGWQAALQEVLEWVNTWATFKNVVISRCDLAADFENELPILSPDLKELLTRAKKKDTHIERYNNGQRLTGYTIGSAALMARIYDKLFELKKSDKAWFKELWRQNGWQEFNPVMRVEFQCRRPFLRMMQVNSPDDLKAQIADLFRYLSQEWLTIRDVGEDSHRSRWPISRLWQAVQCATGQFGQITGVTRLGQMRPRYNHLKAQLRGVLVSLVAINSESLNAADNKVGIAQGRALVKSITAKPDFDSDVANRRARFAGMDARRRPSRKARQAAARQSRSPPQRPTLLTGRCKNQ